MLATCLSALLVSTAVAAPAHAGRRTVTDVAGDVIKQVGTKPPRPAVKTAEADVTTFVTTFGKRKLTLSTTVRDLPKNYWAMLWEVQTDAGVLYDIDLLKTGTVRFTLSSATVPVVCEMTRKVNPVKDKVTITIPLTCLGSPGSVRTGAGAAATRRDFKRIYTDDAGQAGVYSNDGLALGRTVRPG